MLPKIWIFDTYNLLIILGVLASLTLLHFLAEKIKMKKNLKYTISIVAIFSIIVGLGFAMLFQSLFDFLEGNNSRPFAMTFYGGLVGGALCFLLSYWFYVRKRHQDASLLDLLVIAPASITIAHAFGRLGCFAAGCCYGVETDSPLGVHFPGHDHARYPTQLFEAIFLFLLTAVLFYLAYRYYCRYTMPIYLISYGIWRFLIEFIRGDDRGAYMLNLSPSQWFSIFSVLLGIGLIFMIRILIQKEKKTQLYVD